MASRSVGLSWLLALLPAACGEDDAPGTGGTTTGPTTTSASTTLTTTTSVDTTEDGTDGSSSAGSESTAAADSSSSGGPPCPDGHACVAHPDGWNGPVLLRTGTLELPAAPCPSSYPNRNDLGGADLVAPPASCRCSCAAPTEVSCAVSATLRYFGADATCDSAPLTAEIFTTQCNLLATTFAAGAHWIVDPVGVEGGACEPATAMTAEPPVFTTEATACSGAELLEVGCAEDEVCAPRVAEEPLCVWQDGDLDCPDGFDRRDELTVFRAVDDARGCEPCSCDAPVGLCDDARLTLYQNTCNPAITGVIPADGECHAGSAVFPTRTAAFAVGEPTAFCAASTPVPNGAATGSMPVTVCCDG